MACTIRSYHFRFATWVPRMIPHPFPPQPHQLDATSRREQLTPPVPLPRPIMWASVYLRRAIRHINIRRTKDSHRFTFAHLSFASLLILTLLYIRVTSFSNSDQLQIAIRAAAHRHIEAHHTADFSPPDPQVPDLFPSVDNVSHTTASPDGPLRSRVDAIVGHGQNAKQGLTSIYAIPPAVVRSMAHPVATKLYWKLVYTDVVSALRQYQDSTQPQPRFEASSRVLFIHAQNGLGNRLRAIASGLVMARGTRRVPVVVWERDAHLGASFEDLFVTKAYGSDIATILYKDLIVMDTFPSWESISKRQIHWFPVSLMEKDKGNPNALLHFSIPDKQMSLSEPRSLMDSMGAVGDVASSDLQLTRAAQTGGEAVMSNKIDPSMHVYFKSAYVARTQPRHFAYRSNVNRELASIPPSDEVMKIAKSVDLSKLRNAIGIHIRARRLDNDNVDVNSRCEYSSVGAHRTDYWRHQSRLPVFEYKMKVLLERERHATFFVAADDVATVTRLEEVFPGRVQSIGRECDDRNPDCVRYAMADLLCLSKTRRIYGSNWSSFSEAAGRLGNKRIYLSGRHFGKETKSEKKRRMRSERFWRYVDGLPFIRFLNGCWMHDLLRGS